MIARTAKRHAERREAPEQASQKIQLTHPPSYDGFDLLPLGGEWKRGKSQSRLVDRNPYNGEILLEIAHADRSDLDAAYAAAAKAQAAWAASAPALREIVRRS